MRPVCRVTTRVLVVASARGRSTIHMLLTDRTLAEIAEAASVRWDRRRSAWTGDRPGDREHDRKEIQS